MLPKAIETSSTMTEMLVKKAPDNELDKKQLHPERIADMHDECKRCCVKQKRVKQKRARCYSGLSRPTTAPNWESVPPHTPEVLLALLTPLNKHTSSSCLF